MESLGDILRRISVRSTLNNTNGNGVTETAPIRAADLCSLCNGSGWVTKRVYVGHPDFGQAVPCQCQETEDSPTLLDGLRRYSNLGSLSRVSFAGSRPRWPSRRPGQQPNVLASAGGRRELRGKPRGMAGVVRPQRQRKDPSGRRGCQPLHRTAPDCLLHRSRRPVGPPAGDFFPRQPYQLRRAIRTGAKRPAPGIGRPGTPNGDCLGPGKTVPSNQPPLQQRPSHRDHGPAGP